MINTRKTRLPISCQIWVFTTRSMSPRVHHPQRWVHFSPGAIRLIKTCTWKARRESGLVLLPLAQSLSIWDCSWCGARYLSSFWQTSPSPPSISDEDNGPTESLVVLSPEYFYHSFCPKVFVMFNTKQYFVVTWGKEWSMDSKEQD